jgi:hypothetical protein
VIRNCAGDGTPDLGFARVEIARWIGAQAPHAAARGSVPGELANV